MMLNSLNNIQIPHDIEAFQRAIFGCFLLSKEGHMQALTQVVKALLFIS